MCEKPHTDVLELFNQRDLVKVCAPMVRYSKLQFRNLVKIYGCDLTFTPMILADSFCKSPKARLNEFTTNTLDTPLITQFAANTVHDFVGASYLVAPYCDGVDLNCGCPQRWAKDLCLGCEMLNTPQKIFELVRECRNRVLKPFTVSIKTRILPNIAESIELCQNLEKCGVSFLTIHARTPMNNVGPISEDGLKMISDSVVVPVIGNGGLGSLKECQGLQEKTGVKGVMVANAVLTNPELFSGSTVTSLGCVQQWLDICYNSTLTIDDYISDSQKTISERPRNLTFQCFHHHLVFMLEKLLTKKQRRVFNNMKSFTLVLRFLEQNFRLKPRKFPADYFQMSIPFNLDFQGRSVLYEELKPKENEDHIVDVYGAYWEGDGKYFKGKFDLDVQEESDCDWSGMFFEND
ncbi:tRNA-dihydrouridine(20a/20b) synthase [NAD(P)+]-like [Euwallacea fornicatus]|uniref:tRNA-dihydrouridine(20a/20b) synthase [NAD(P)+]-like n=1 Tax=Euwallacea fornicatus TaxID=995702 RepID=UPI0033902B2B